MAVIASLLTRLGIESSSFTSGLDNARRQLKKTERDFKQIGDKMAGLGAKLSVGLTLPLAGFGAKAVQEATEAQAAMGQVEAALASMGPVAGRTAEQLKAAADSFEKSSLFEADQILTQVTANLLTFGNIAGEAFDRAQQAALDMATRLGTEPQAAAMMLGKALNDPLKGITALTRSGVQFTEQQKAQIGAMMAAGNAAGAQAIILGEVERQFRGAAQAAQDADPWNKAKDAFNQVAETVGNSLIKVLPPLAEAIASVADWFSKLSPTTQRWIIITAGAGAALGPLLIALGSMVSTAGTLLPLLIKMGPVFTILKTGIGYLIPLIWAAVKALAAMALTPVGAVITGIAVAVGAVYLAWKNWDRIVPIVRELYNGVKAWIGDKLGSLIDWAKEKVKSLAAPFLWVYDKVVGHSYVPDMVDGIAYHMGRLDKEMVEPARRAAAATAEAMRGALDAVSDSILQTGPVAGASAEDIKASLEDLADEGLPDLSAAAEDHTARMIESFAHMAQDVVGSLRGMVASFKRGDILGGLSAILDIVSQVTGFIRGLKQPVVPAFPGGGIGGGIPRFATGGSFKVGGTGGVDSQLMRFWATPGEMVDIRRPGNDNGGSASGGGGNVYQISGNLLTPEFWTQIQALDAQTLAAAPSLTQGHLARRARRGLRR